jgi:glycosyltransferase involved in cell wall biosynthesis
MISKVLYVLFSDSNTLVSVTDSDGWSVKIKSNSILEVLEIIGLQYEDHWIYFSNEIDAHSIPFKDIEIHLKHPNTLVSIGTRSDCFMSTDIGYVEDGPFISVGKESIYPTWQMIDRMGVMHSSLLGKLPSSAFQGAPSFVYWLNSVAVRLRPQGLCCYRMYVESLPQRIGSSMDTTLLYRFVSQHYKKRWTLLLFLSHLLFEVRFPLFAFAKAQWYKKQLLIVDFDTLKPHDEELISVPFEIDVIIPTIGREAYLYDVLKDLSAQTILPKNVIIVEQDQDPNMKTALDYLTSEVWPFEIQHHFIHQTGACNARNVAMEQVKSPWVLFFDDDIRCNTDMVAKIKAAMCSTKAKAITLACLQEGEEELMKAFKQWESFGSGCSVVHKEVVEQLKFDMSLEHGYGEDVDFGMQIRQAGYDILYAPQIQLKHLKAPVGGFREPHVFPWKEDGIQPKPSPQIMYHRQKNYTPKQLLGYKMVLFLKAFRAAKSINPFAFYTMTKAGWEASKTWAAKL